MQTKKWYQSKTIWGVLITAIAFLVNRYLQADIVVPANPDFDQLKQIADQVKESHGTADLFNTIIGAIGIIIAFIGRIKAESKVSLPKLLSKATMLIGFILIAGIASAQIKSSPFKPIPKPVTHSLAALSVSTSHDITAWRFTPMAGYNVSTKQLQAGIGYGIQWLRFIDSTQKYYSDFSINAVGWVNGSTAPSLNPPNFASFGITVGVLNQLIQGGLAYTPATPDTKGKLGLIVNLAIPLNN